MNKSTILAISIIGLSIIGVSAYFITKDTQSADNSTQNSLSNNTSQNSITKIYSKEEVAKHSTSSDCWTIISGIVYDLTKYVTKHSGGNEIVRACGIDSTSLFTKRQAMSGESVGSGSPHSDTAKSDLSTLQIGTLAN